MPERIDKLRRKMEQLAQTEKWDELISVYTKCIALEKKPNKKAMAYYNRGLAYGMKEDADRAIADFNEAIELNSNDANAYYTRGVAYSKKENYDQVIADCNRAIELNPDHASAYYNRGVAYGLKKNYDQAIADFNRAIELNPDYADAYYNRGVFYSKKGDDDQAIADFNKVIEHNANHTIAYISRGVVYGKKENYDQAIADFNEVIEFSPNHVEAYYNRGVAYSNKGDADRAIADFNKAIELRPNHAGTYYNRGVAYIKKEDSDRAIADFNEAIELNPDDTDSYYNRGIIYGRKGAYNQAIKDFLKTGDLEPQQKSIFSLVYISHRLKAIYADELNEGAPGELLRSYGELTSRIINIQKQHFYDPDKHEKERVSHYTALNTLKSLADNNPFRLYNVTYMSDPEEGQTFFEIMNEKATGVDINVKSQFYSNNPRSSPAYIGSFVIVDSENEEPKDKLILWRLYGKQDKEEASGACLIFKPDSFAKSHPQPLGSMAQMGYKDSGSEAQELAKTRPALYKVAYISDRKDENIDEDLQELLTSLAESLKEIDTLITQDQWKSKENDLRELVGELLDSIRFLFKKGHYREEHEVRIIDLHYYEEGMREKPDRVKVDKEQMPPRFYLETSENFRFSEVILGPRAQNIQDWKMWIKNQNQEIDVQQSDILYGSRFS